LRESTRSFSRTVRGKRCSRVEIKEPLAFPALLALSRSRRKALSHKGRGDRNFFRAIPVPSGVDLLRNQKWREQMRALLLSTLLVAAFALPATAAQPVKGAAKGTATAAKGVARGTVQAGSGVVKGTGTAARGVGRGLKCVVTLGTRC
jgi:hypothetical protein